MISVIVCSKTPASETLHRRHVAATIGCDHEYIRIDNTSNTYGLCGAYNAGVKQSVGDICVFVHEDVFFITPGWGGLLVQNFAANPRTGCIGVAGTQYLFKDNPFWAAPGRPFIKGRVVHETPESGVCIRTVFSEDETDAEAVAVDGLFFAIRKELFPTIQFDERTFDRFHFYDLDICMQVRKTHKIIVTSKILVKHFSGGSFRETWREYADRFIKKYSSMLPVSCSGTVPDPAHRIPFDSYPLDTLLSSKASSVIAGIGKENTRKTGSAGSLLAEKPIIAITGMHRSGTSCIAGLLSKCGFSAGSPEELLNENKAQADNTKGHFENLSVVVINNTALTDAGGTWFNPPSPESIEKKAAAAAGEKIRRFNRTFSGTIIKDPRLCLTLDLWNRHCSRLSSVVICFRHPLGVAHSLKRRNDIPIEMGLKLWYVYNTRLIGSIAHLPAMIVDYDSFSEHLDDDLLDLLAGLHSPLSREEMKNAINGFFENDLNHHQVSAQDTGSLPDSIRQLYVTLKSQSIAVCRGRPKGSRI